MGFRCTSDHLQNHFLNEWMNGMSMFMAEMEKELGDLKYFSVYVSQHYNTHAEEKTWEFIFPKLLPVWIVLKFSQAEWDSQVPVM